MEEVQIRGEMIRLGQLLKLSGILDSGAQAKDFLAVTEVLVNGESEHRRGRQLHGGDLVTVAGESVRIVTGR
jgi:ribosome-associated protein